MKSSTPRDAVRLSPNAITVLERRYLIKDESGAPVESPQDLFWRVARTVAQADLQYGASKAAVDEVAHAFFGLMANRLFVPNSPTLMNAGRPLGQLSACFVLPVDDALSNGKSGIYDTLRAMALVHQSGGGTGFSFSRLRPKNDIVRSTMGVASGPVSFMTLFDASTDVVKQGGTRRGANMGILRIDHPDVLEFIDCKLDGGITNFNISVAVTDSFMDALAKGEDYDLINPHSGEVTQRLSAREVFDRIVRAAWRTGDPGMVFIDRINASPANPTPELGTIEATNPCGEQPLLPNEACNLGSLNVSKFARQDAAGEWSMDWDEMERVVRLAVRFLDDVIEMNPYPLPQIDDTVKANRRIGLGIMGWADLLFTMGIPYDSQEAIDLADRLMLFVKQTSHDQCGKLAEERGPFPNWNHSIYRNVRPMRNSTVTTIAPTGTISMIAGCSSGIEPIFALAFQHRVKQPDGERVLTFVNETFERLAKEQGFYSDALMQEVAKRGTLHGIPGVPEEAQHVFKTSHDIAFEWHVRHQASFQRFTDNGVSKTINLPTDPLLQGFKWRSIGPTGQLSHLSSPTQGTFP
jgi:ribonucleoside-diphosphate reductase alpha chain